MFAKGKTRRSTQPHKHKHAKKPETETHKRAKKRWQMVLGRVTAGQYHDVSAGANTDEFNNENLIEEIKRMKREKQGHDKRHKGGGILNILGSHHEDDGVKGLGKQMYSAKERILRKRASSKSSHLSVSHFSLQDYDTEARLRYPITSEIRIKLERIKREAENEREKQTKGEEGPGNIFKQWFRRLVKWLVSTNMGKTVAANYRFYKMSPHEHLPDLCRRCRRPLLLTLEGRFTSIGILFSVFVPVVGILLLYLNREFYCVVCQEVYVYGDLTSRVHDLDKFDGEQEVKDDTGQ